jgi:phage terminase large subunit
VFGQCWFDERRCEVGLRGLQHYRREWKDRQRKFASPIHDWASHCADAFRYFAVSSQGKPQPMKLPPLKYPKRPSFI